MRESELQDMSRLLTEIRVIVGRMEERINDNVAAQKSLASQVTQDHEPRLRSLERRMWSLPSAAVGVAGAGLALSIANWAIHGS
jgi:hypothetical protein